MGFAHPVSLHPRLWLAENEGAASSELASKTQKTPHREAAAGTIVCSLIGAMVTLAPS